MTKPENESGRSKTIAEVQSQVQAWLDERGGQPATPVCHVTSSCYTDTMSIDDTVVWDSESGYGDCEDVEDDALTFESVVKAYQAIIRSYLPFLDKPVLTFRSGTHLISAERMRQIWEKGYTEISDDLQTAGQLRLCAQLILDGYQGTPAAYAKEWPDSQWPSARATHVADKYPFDDIKKLTIAGALIAAEIDRLRRLQAKQPSPSGQ
jgi:hypothetical protein